MLPDRPARRSTLSRRGLLKGGGVLAFAGVSAAALKLPLFSVDGVTQSAAECRATDVSETERELIISNWTGYIDPRRNPESTMNRFQDETGITVTYNVDINDNAEFYAKVRNQLGACEPIDRDLMMLTDWMAARMINLGWIQPLNAEAIPNVHANVIDPLRGIAWDPEFEYHAPWQSGLTGIAYNAAEVGEVGSFEELISRPDLAGRITLLSEMADTMGFMLKVVGADPEDFDDDDWANAMDRMRQVVEDGHLRQIAGNNYLQQLAQGSIVACEAWSGDVIQAQYDNEDIKFVVPEEGVALWSDNMMVPNKASHQANAEAWIDFYYRPEIAAKLAAWVNYICPVQGAREEMESIDPSLVDNPLIFPDEAMLANTWDFMALTDEQQQKYEGEWADVIAG
jgi:spermidine/putrescine transport system substrate-binding protein